MSIPEEHDVPSARQFVPGRTLHYDDDGQMTECYRLGEEAFGYRYDELNRLTGVDRGFDGVEIVPDWVVEYDEAGSRRTEATEMGIREYQYEPGSHRLVELAPEGSGRRESWLYNVDGSVAGREEELVIPGQVNTEVVRAESFEYGWQDRVTGLRVATPSGPGHPETETDVTFDYDASGREIRRAEGSDVTIYLRDAWGNARADLDATGAVQTWWTLPGKGGGSEIGGGGKDGGRQGTTIAAIDPTTLEPVTFLHSDHVGTIRQVTDAEGHLVSRLDVLPFGEEMRSETVIDLFATAEEVDAQARSTERGFAGTRDEPSARALQRFEARWYDVEAGRFLSIDPVWKGQAPPLHLLTNPQWLHAYAYGGADPLGTVDPDGMILDTIWDLGSLTYSAVTFINDPSWINAGWVAADVVALAVPILPASGGARAGVKRAVAKGAKAAGEATVAAPEAARAVDPNKLHHIFERGGHGLGDVVEAAGSRQAAFEAMEEAAQSAFNAGKLTQVRPGVFEGPVNVGGLNVTVRGAAVDGAFRIGSAWR
jgi:RHS repeat-associated protein